MDRGREWREGVNIGNRERGSGDRKGKREWREGGGECVCERGWGGGGGWGGDSRKEYREIYRKIVQ